MNIETTNSMNFYLQRNDDHINAAIPKAMRALIKEVSVRMNMTESAYIKLALRNQLENDLSKPL